MTSDVRFACDAMLGGLSRWLRAMGYEAEFDDHVEDGELVARAARDGSVLLSSDAPLFERKLMKSGAVRGLFVPRHAPVEEQLVFVMRSLSLELREARCMRCGGSLRELAREDARAEAPPRAFQSSERFFRCAGCARLYWHGTHWHRIAAARARIAAESRAS